MLKVVSSGATVELVYYDDQSNPAHVPPIYAKLLDVDKIDLVISSYGTNMTMPVMPVVIPKNRVVMSLFALAVNDEFKYPYYFSMFPAGSGMGFTRFHAGFSRLRRNRGRRCGQSASSARTRILQRKRPRVPTTTRSQWAFRSSTNAAIHRPQLISIRSSAGFRWPILTLSTSHLII